MKERSKKKTLPISIVTEKLCGGLMLPYAGGKNENENKKKKHCCKLESVAILFIIIYTLPSLALAVCNSYPLECCVRSFSFVFATEFE
jgi:hypothetical protein